MELIRYQRFIQNLPYLDQAFVINKKTWLGGQEQIDRIIEIFAGESSLMISRKDLFEEEKDIGLFIIKTLMWGYPSKGRGKNIEIVFEPDNFDRLGRILLDYSCMGISNKRLQQDIQSIPNLGLSTMTKFVYFLKTKVEGIEGLIFDKMVIDALNSNSFREFAKMPFIPDYKSGRFYPAYLHWAKEQAEELGCQPDQLEYFLYGFARNLKY